MALEVRRSDGIGLVHYRTYRQIHRKLWLRTLATSWRSCKGNLFASCSTHGAAHGRFHRHSLRWPNRRFVVCEQDYQSLSNPVSWSTSKLVSQHRPKRILSGHSPNRRYGIHVFHQLFQPKSYHHGSLRGWYRNSTQCFPDLGVSMSLGVRPMPCSKAQIDHTQWDALCGIFATLRATVLIRELAPRSMPCH